MVRFTAATAQHASLLLDDHAIETCIQYLDNVRMSAFRQDVDLPEEAVQALTLVDHVLDAHDLDGDLLLGLQVDGQFHPIRQNRMVRKCWTEEWNT